MSRAPVRKPFHVLVLCTGNSARSIIAEALINDRGRGRFRAFSAGSRPKGEVHPCALRALREAHVAVDAPRSKSWDEFARPGAPVMDLVITVCDSAAGEACPLWPGGPVRAHWGVPDPAGVPGTDEQRMDAFRTALRRLDRRVRAMTGLPRESLDPAVLAGELRRIHSEPD